MGDERAKDLDSEWRPGGGAVGRMEEENELEEGEAYSLQEEEEDEEDSCIDPDSLSYIDEKVQNVLGHFQKDFEDAKFGGYGSDFLPSEATMASQAHVVIQENWVCCDECHKWCLLPYVTDPYSLPKIWKCSSIDWLPGMNSCAVSEEEATRSVHALYVAPFPDVSATNHHILVSGDTSTGGVYQNQNITHNDQNLSSVGNENTVKDAVGHLSHSTGTPFSTFGKKNQQTTRSLNDGDW